MRWFLGVALSLLTFAPDSAGAAFCLRHTDGTRYDGCIEVVTPHASESSWSCFDPITRRYVVRSHLDPAVWKRSRQGEADWCPRPSETDRASPVRTGS